MISRSTFLIHVAALFAVFISCSGALAAAVPGIMTDNFPVAVVFEPDDSYTVITGQFPNMSDALKRRELIRLQDREILLLIRGPGGSLRSGAPVEWRDGRAFVPAGLTIADKGFRLIRREVPDSTTLSEATHAAIVSLPPPNHPNPVLELQSPVLPLASIDRSSRMQMPLWVETDGADQHVLIFGSVVTGNGVLGVDLVARDSVPLHTRLDNTLYFGLALKKIAATGGTISGIAPTKIVWTPEDGAFEVETALVMESQMSPAPDAYKQGRIYPIDTARIVPIDRRAGELDSRTPPERSRRGANWQISFLDEPPPEEPMIRNAFEIVRQRLNAVVGEDYTLEFSIRWIPLAGDSLGSTAAAFASQNSRFYTTQKLGLQADGEPNEVELDELNLYNALPDQVLPVLFDAALGVDNVERVATTRANESALLEVDLAGDDARFTFNSNIERDFNPIDGVQEGQNDFVGTVHHEVFHALGFLTVGDFQDSLVSLDPKPVFTLDFFRLSTGTAQDGVSQFIFGATNRTVALGDDASFVSRLNDGNADFPMVPQNKFEEQFQLSHWSRAVMPIGLMEPLGTPGETKDVTDADWLALDRIGWDVTFPTPAGAAPPDPPANPGPENGRLDISPDASLTLSAISPGTRGLADNFTITLRREDGSLVSSSTGLSSASLVIDAAFLEPRTTYVWVAVAANDLYGSQSERWTFETLTSGDCPADFTSDGLVGPPDLSFILANWGPCSSPFELCVVADLDQSGAVGPADLATVLATWGACP